MRRDAIKLGLVLAAFQIGLACLLAPGKSLSQSYHNLCVWDCLWYESVARDGYHSPVPPVAQRASVSNVAFFPAYPFAARALYRGLGVPPKIALLVVSQLFCVVFWAALITCLERWRIPRTASALVVFAVIAHPASLFLALGYSESLFLSTLLLMLAYARRSAGAASAAGFLMSATRIIGAPAAGLPVLQQLASARRRGLGRAFVVSAVAASGTLLFFAYCQLRFGRYDLYMQTQRIGWNIVPNYKAVWSWPRLQFKFSFDRATMVASVTGLGLLLAAEAWVALRRTRTGLRRRLPLYAIAFVIFFVTVSGLESVQFRSMIRYSLPWCILLALCAAHLSMRLPRLPRALRALAALLAMASLLYLFYGVELPHFREFLRGLWYA